MAENNHCWQLPYYLWNGSRQTQNAYPTVQIFQVFFSSYKSHFTDVIVGARHSISSEFESVILESFLFKGVAESEAMSQPYRHQ